jgi:hypothetical protein
MQKFSRQGIKRMSKINSEISFERKNSAQRSTVEQFIRRSFFDSYGANVDYFSQLLVSCNNQYDELVAAFGITKLAHQKAYLEQYLSNPVEIEIANIVGREVKRKDIFELGNLAASYPGATRILIEKMATDLHKLGARWVVFTANSMVNNAFQKLGLHPIALQEAKSELLKNCGANWGSYYEDKPKVMFIEVPEPRKSNH